MKAHILKFTEKQIGHENEQYIVML